MDCKWTDCSNQARAKSPFCSGTCKKRYQRASGTDEVGQPSGTEGVAQALCAGRLEHYYANPDRYAPRAMPDKLNWGPWLDTAQLEQAGLKANRVTIPGDWDYAGAGSALMRDIDKVNAITIAAQDEYTSMRSMA